MNGKDRGATIALLAPILAALIGGGAAVLAAAQVVNLAGDSETSQSEQAELSGAEVDYGTR